MLEQIADHPGIDLDLDSYSDAFDQAYERISFWKLERGQEFREPGLPSWEAFAAGDWTRSLECNAEQRASVAAKIAEDGRLGVESRRVRITERPVTGYLQWEMQYFRLLAEAGEAVRVLDAEHVRSWERHRALPEIVILGDRVLFEVVYDATGAATGARRIDDPDVIKTATREVAELFERGEPLLDYYRREIAPLPPPAR